MLVFEPQISMGLWWALAAAAVLVWLRYALTRDSGLSWLRRGLILLFMAASMSMPLCLLLNPTWVQPRESAGGKPLLSILVDASQSMQVDDENGGSRWQSALNMASKVIEQSQGTVDVRALRFGKQMRILADPINLGTEDDPAGSNTNLTAVLQQTLRVNRPQGHAIALMSDGAHNVGSTIGVLSAADQARAVNVPIFTSAFGGMIGANNISLAVRNPQAMTFPGRTIRFGVRVSHRGFQGRTLTVKMQEGETRVAAKRVKLTKDGYSEIEFALKPDQAGTYRYVVSVDEVDGEATAADNQASLQLQVIDEPIRILLLEGKPYWDTKFLARNLAADPAIELTCLVRIRDDRFMRRVDRAQMNFNNEPPDSDVPSGQWEIVSAKAKQWEGNTRLQDYRIIVLGRDADRFLDEDSLKRLEEWIGNQGGALVCARGEPSDLQEQKLKKVLPVRWNAGGEFRARGQLTSIGQSASLLPSDLSIAGDPIAALPSLAITSRPRATLGLPQVLVQSEMNASGQAVPIITHQPYGSGQSVVVEGAGMWRWAFLPPEQAEAQRVYASLWQGLMQWLISQQDLLPGQEISVRSDRLAFVTGDDVTASILVSSDTPPKIPDCLLSGDTLELPRRAAAVPVPNQKGVYRSSFGTLPPGHYRVALEGHDPQLPGAVSEFDVRDPWSENLDVDARPGLLRQIAKRSGGRFVDPESPEQILNSFQEQLALARPEKQRKSPAWDRKWVLTCLLFLWTCTWLLRRRSGLV